MDPLEKRIQDLQEQLQAVEQPDRLAIWEGIARRPESPRRWQRYWPWALGALLLLGSGMGIGIWWNEQQHQQNDSDLMADLPEPWQQKAREYQQLVSHQEQAVQASLTDVPNIEAELHELQLLDSMHQDFLNDYQSLPKDDRTAARYLHYYEQKIRILELIVKAIQIQKNESEKRIQYDL